MLKKLTGLFILTFTLLSTLHSFAQESPFKGASDLFINKDGDLDYLSPWLYLRQNESTFDKNMYMQAYATYASFLGETHHLKGPKLKPEHLESYEFINPFKAIMPKAQEASLLILNEAHHVPSHRAFALSMLDSLQKAGYSVLSLEGLSYEDKGLNERGYPIASSGFYTREPLFANFIRAAILKGFKVVGHEIKPEQEIELNDWIARSNHRDSIQAVNLLSILQKYPDQKVFAYVGYDHVLEKARGKFKRMATYLKEAGIDALTIDQEMHCECDADLLKAPAVLTKDGQGPITTGSRMGFVDLQVIHSITDRGDLKGWLSAYTGYKEKKISIPKKHQSNRLLVQVYDKKEFTQSGDKAIPVYQGISHGNGSQLKVAIPSFTKDVTVQFTPVK